MEFPRDGVPLLVVVSRKPQNDLRLVSSASFNFILSPLTFILVFVQLQKTTSTDVWHYLYYSNTSSLEAEPSCTSPIYVNSILFTVCSGYTTIPTVNVPSQNEVGRLDMSLGNNLQVLTDGQLERANLPKLAKLYLDHCQIREIHRGAFRGGSGLTYLSLESNQIQILDPQVFNGLVKLEVLSLDRNPIKSFQLETVFPPLVSLKELGISGCELSIIPENAFDNIRNLRNLYLDYNNLSTLSWKVFRNFDTNELTFFGRNPWQCDCHFRFLNEILGKYFEPMSGCTTSKDDKSYMNCPPRVEGFEIDLKQSNVQIQLGDDVHFECTYSGYPPPTVKWLKDGNTIETGAAEIKNMTFDLLNDLDVEEMKRNIRFKQVLRLPHVKASDSGNYTCFVENVAGQIGKDVLFKLNDKMTDGGMTVWMWTLVGILGTLALIFLTCSVILMRRIWANRTRNAMKNPGQLNHRREASTGKGPSSSNLTLGLLDRNGRE